MTNPPDQPLLYLTDADVAALALDVGAVRTAIHDAFRDYGAGRVRCEPKTSIVIVPGHAFQSLSAADTGDGFAAVKWIGMVPPGGAAAITINASILLSDVQTGQLRCLMDARRITALRTAGMSAVATRYLARTDSASIGFVGAGVQAESHLLALAEAMPLLRTVRVNSRTAATAERFAAWSRERGFEAEVTTAEDAVSRSDIVVTTVPLSPGFEPFIEAAWVRPGACVLAVDLGRSWKHEGLMRADLTVVDEEAMKHYAKPGNLVPPLGYAHATLADLASGRHPGRTNAGERIFAFSSGSGVADLAIGTLVHERARARGIGLVLPTN